VPVILQGRCDNARMRRPLALSAAFVLAAAASAPAHDPARLNVVSPAEGARVSSPVRVQIRGEGGSAAAAFKLDLDGQVVDAAGRIGGVFSSLSVEPGKTFSVEVDMALGAHTLTATPAADPDAPRAPVVRRFTVVAGGSSGIGALPLAVAGVALAAVVGAAVVVGRKRTA
jgi:hypothetical protein